MCENFSQRNHLKLNTIFFPIAIFDKDKEISLRLLQASLELESSELGSTSGVGHCNATVT